MRMQIAALAVLATSPALAQWRALSGPKIAGALSERKLVHEGAWQQFEVSDRTHYNAGSDSWGKWRAEGHQYCSQWPPAGGWACYAIARDDDTGALRFEGESGDLTVGHYAK